MDMAAGQVLGRGGRHAVLSLTTRFRLPHEGMTHMEYLSRCVSCPPFC